MRATGSGGSKIYNLLHEQVVVPEWARRDSNPHEVLSSGDFKSPASANSATGPNVRKVILHDSYLVVDKQSLGSSNFGILVKNPNQ